MDKDRSLHSFSGNQNFPFKYPHASTPMGSPDSIANESSVSIKSHRANLKLPVGPLAYTGKSSKEKNLNRSFANVTIRDNNHDATTGATISPIAASAFRNQIQLTEVRGGCKQFFSNKACSNPNGTYQEDRRGLCSDVDSVFNSSKVLPPKSVFPYPASDSEYNIDVVEPAETLYNNLRALAAFKKVETEKLRLLGRKKKEKPDEKVPVYEFTSETFCNVNSEASIYALHLVFTSIDEKDAEQRFRDCWPVYEKKLEGIFRRVSLEWMKQLIVAYPMFFRDLKTEALGGLLVNPGGDRFISAMNQFCRLAVFTLTNRKKALIRQQILHPAEPTKDPEIANRQVHSLNMRRLKLSGKAFNSYKMVNIIEVTTQDRFTKMQHLKERNEQCTEMLFERVKNICIHHPDIFGDVLEEDLIFRSEILSEVTIEEMVEDEYEDFVKKRLEEKLQQKAAEIYKSVSRIQELNEDYSKIWYILDPDNPKSVTLDCRQMLQNQLQSANGDLLLNNFFDYFRSTISNLLSNTSLNSPLPTEIQQEYEAVCLRINFLNMLQMKVNEAALNPSFYSLESVKNKRNALKLRLDSYDWSQLSQVKDYCKNKVWDMTPIRVFDINRPSGRTPGITNFLDSSALLISGGDHQTSIIKRRVVKPRIVPRIHRPTTEEVMAHDEVDCGSDRSTNKNVNISHSKTGCESSCTPISTNQSSRSRLTTTQQMSSVLDSTSHSFLRKSVSFEDPSRGDSTLEMSRSSTHNDSKLSTPFTSNQSLQQLQISPIRSGEVSIVSDDVPDGLDESTHERVNKLLQLISSNSPITRSPQSPFDNLNEEFKDEINKSSGVTDTAELFGNLNLISVTEDKKEAESTIDKGIMETSHIELFQNSDSDTDE